MLPRIWASLSWVFVFPRTSQTQTVEPKPQIPEVRSPSGVIQPIVRAKRDQDKRAFE